jgi:serine/threonine protein phosphatase 1
MRILAIGDIHGCSRALDTLLTLVEPAPADLLITLGDYVDRGPDSPGVLDRLLQLHATGRLVALRGNHDHMMRAARHGFDEKQDWLVCGGKATLAAYSPRGDSGSLDDVPARHWDFLDRLCVDWYETDTHFFVHANAYPELPLAEQPEYMLFWEPLEEARRHCSGKIMVCGHTRQRNGWPLNLGDAICIDTWVYGPGWLTCLDVKSGQIWQANQRGEQRTGWLDQGPS